MGEKRDVRKIIGNNLKFIRKKLRYSLQKMADECALDYAHYCRIEQGKQYVRLDILQKISDNLGVAMDFWFRNDRSKLESVYNKLIYDNIGKLSYEQKEFLLDMLLSYQEMQREIRKN